MSFDYNDHRNDPPEEGSTEPHDSAAPTPPRRDTRGRFAGGNHNPSGRPKKVPPPNSLSEAVARALAEPVTVTIKGKPTKIPSYEALGLKLVQMLLSADPVNTGRVFRVLDKLRAFDELRDQQTSLAAEESGNAWTPELEAQYQALEASWNDDEDDAVAAERRDPPPEEPDGEAGASA